MAITRDRFAAKFANTAVQSGQNEMSLMAAADAGVHPTTRTGPKAVWQLVGVFRLQPPNITIMVGRLKLSEVVTTGANKARLLRDL